MRSRTLTSHLFVVLILVTMGCESVSSSINTVHLTATPPELSATFDEQQSELDVDTEIKNSGRSTVSLLSVSSSCGCTIVRDVIPKVLAAGGVLVAA